MLPLIPPGSVIDRGSTYKSFASTTQGCPHCHEDLPAHPSQSFFNQQSTEVQCPVSVLGAAALVSPLTVAL